LETSRIATRYEKKAENYLAMLTLALSYCGYGFKTPSNEWDDSGKKTCPISIE